tara:strand:+ start:701 stop:1324 length:624 start_codon:yes stop_codon:yes gene_type:complete
MTYSITPDYQDYLGYGSGPSGEFGGLGPQKPSEDTTESDDGGEQDDSPANLVAKVKNFLSDVFREDAAKVNTGIPKIKTSTNSSTILAQYNIEPNFMGEYNSVDNSSEYYETLITTEKDKSIFEQDIEYLSSLYQSRNNARMNERVKESIDKRSNPKIEEPIKVDDLMRPQLRPKIMEYKIPDYANLLKPTKRPLGLMSKNNLEGLY